MTKITAPTMVDLIAKVYQTEGWKHRVGTNKTARVMKHYVVMSDQVNDQYIATRKDPIEEGAKQLSRKLGGMLG